ARRCRALGYQRWLRDPDRERGGRRLGRREAEERAQRLAGGLGSAVVRQDVEGTRRRAAAGEPRREPSAEDAEVARVIGQEVERSADVGLERFGRLTEERIRGCLSVRDALAIIELDEHDALLGPYRARDGERPGE